MRLCALFHAVLSITFIRNGQVNYSASRGYHLKIPANIASIPDDFIQCVQGLAGPSGPPRPEATVFFGLPSSIPYTQTPCLGAKSITCTTKDLASLSDRSQEAIHEALDITDTITQVCLFSQYPITH